MNKYFKTALCLALSLAFLLGCSKQSSTTSSSSAKSETTQIDSTSQQTTENKSEVRTVTFVNDTHSDLHSTLTYIVDGDNVLKHSGHNVYDPVAIGTTAETLKASVEEAYKGYEGLKGVTQSIEIKDGKVVQHTEIDFTVASLDELKKALPDEYSGIGDSVSFSASEKMLKNLGYTEKTN